MNDSGRYRSPILHYGFYVVLFATAAATLVMHTVGHAAHEGAATNCASYKTVSVQVSDTGFSQSNITEPVCTSVRFTNTGTKLHEPAIGAHEHHDPAFLSSEKALKPGQSTTYSFNRTGTYALHDHIDDQFQGVITIK